MGEKENKNIEDNNSSGTISSTTFSTTKSRGPDEAEKNEWQLFIEDGIEETKAGIKEIKRDKISFITILGIFVAIFTFISVEIQVFRYICDFHKIIGFTFILPGILLLFISLLDYVARSWTSNITKNYIGLGIVVFISIVLIVIGVIFSLKSSGDWKCPNLEMNKPIQVYPQSQPDIKIDLPDSLKVQIIK